MIFGYNFFGLIIKVLLWVWWSRDGNVVTWVVTWEITWVNHGNMVGGTYVPVFPFAAKALPSAWPLIIQNPPLPDPVDYQTG